MSERYTDGYLGYALATQGIPADVELDEAGDYDPDPWRPPPGEPVVRITIPMSEADRLGGMVQWKPVQGDGEPSVRGGSDDEGDRE